MLALLTLLATADTNATGYWQQRVDYRISASLDEPAGVLTGHVRITYVNHSPHTLHDFFVHQYLNAFRPGSRWAAADSAAGVVRYQHMKDPDYAFERITGATVMGVAARPDYPDAPDSTVAHWTLPAPLAPGDSAVVEIDWQARPSTLPRRQGRDPKGRRFDFAQWYPKVAVFDRYGWEDHPLYPAGEFYGEFGTFDVTLDLPEDQVIGATGVPVCGDPGWERADAAPGRAIDYQRLYYGDVPHDCPAAAPGRKTVRFRAEQVHHFAFSLNPKYRYEEGRYGPSVVRVLYQPGDSTSWGRGVAVHRTETALAWLDSLYGPFAWPQVTNVHRIEGGGTEFPMMVMNGGASQGLILHEVGHNYTMGILANNEWREGWLDEGFTSFQTGLYFESHGGQPGYAGIEPWLATLDAEGWSEPVSLVSERYRDFATYNTMIYSKAQLFYEELRYVVGDDALRQILRAYYARWRLKHVDQAAFESVCEEVSGQDLTWLFGQWLHGTPLIDYKLQQVDRRELPGGRWETTVVIRRLGDGFMPVEIADDSVIYARATGQPVEERVTFTSDHKPGRLVLDPRVRAHDWNLLNNAEPRWWTRSRREWRLDDPTRETVRRDRLVVAFLPVIWSNDAGGVTVGVRSRSNYLEQYERHEFIATNGLKPDATNSFGFYGRIADPLWWHWPRTETSLAGWYVEGRAGAAVSVDRSLRSSFAQESDPRAGFDLLWMSTTDVSYLDRKLWDDAGTLEAGPWWSTRTTAGRNTIAARIGARGGVVYRYPGAGIVSANRYDMDGFLRATAEASLRRPFLWPGSSLGFRLFGGGYLSGSPPPLQRRIGVAGTDPYQTFTNPFLRSQGALFVRPDFFYQAPGDANLRGFAPSVGGRWAVSANLEGAQDLITRRDGFVRRVALFGFVDAGIVDTMAVPSSPAGRWYTTVYDGGLGLVSRHVLRDLDWTFRLEFPLVVNRWDQAADVRPGEARTAFRWQVSLSPSF